MTHFITISTIQKRKSFWYSKHETCYYCPVHYKTQLNIAEVNRTLKLIPANASVAASAKLAPHISLRDKVYHFPNINKAAFIVVILNNENCYPLTVEAYFHKIESLKKSDEYVIDFQSDDLLILKRKSH